MDSNNSERKNNKPRMNEDEFLKKWINDKPIYEAWGNFIQNEVQTQLFDIGKDLNSFLKVPVKYRLKDDKSIIDKAFHRNKGYSDPYHDIEDKVGIRFIVLLLEDINDICNIIKSSNQWSYDECKHFEQEKEESPLAFGYQSVHYILRPKVDIQLEDVTITTNTPCEVQVRTLLQHAHAELTHDQIYKATKKVKPSVYRTVAKSMALIETTDDFFRSVSIELNNSKFKEFNIKEKLDSLYFLLIGIHPTFEKSSAIIWDAYEYLIDDELMRRIEKLFQRKQSLAQLITSLLPKNSLYRQSTILFIIYLILKKPNDADREWPISRKDLDEIAADLGASLINE
ncbi:ppGpp synthetase/RelA/SpoT-type nucleotidyltransferase [Marinomonas alcarazii]|uniref:PpGpp synthetase/RelA/SpoT-type nucleotidyltransferase n=1 Tax=Marinomonas alcarazii TaxID=491949 RepID=A0A318VE11_9GAMM|nr:RelA/SpoT domain-containing protein [Marinomonas alcarazii]PYF84615.1 ppGpp synthetase/RelA/SpoT-type nucleotidyltransferase [Marinomonas alcarazii]